MRHFILAACLISGGFALVGPVEAETPPSGDLSKHFADHPDVEDVEVEIDVDAGFLAFEVAEASTYTLPDRDHDDEVTLVQLAENSGARILDIAGVERTPAGRPVDAPPGSLDAAYTGMQHDLGAGTVRNTVDPEPTPSAQVAEIVAERPDLVGQPAPSAQEPLEAEKD